MNEKQVVVLRGIVSELSMLLLELNSFGMEAYPDFESEGAQRIEKIFLAIREQKEELRDIVVENY